MAAKRKKRSRMSGKRGTGEGRGGPRRLLHRPPTAGVRPPPLPDLLVLPLPRAPLPLQVGRGRGVIAVAAVADEENAGAEATVEIVTTENDATIGTEAAEGVRGGEPTARALLQSTKARAESGKQTIRSAILANLLRLAATRLQARRQFHDRQRPCPLHKDLFRSKRKKRTMMSAPSCPPPTRLFKARRAALQAKPTN